MKKIIAWGFLLAAIGALVLVFRARQEKISGIRAENDALHRQLEKKPSVQTTPTPAAPAANVVPPLSADERSELLRLRGQVQPLRREVQELSNRMATAKQPKSMWSTMPMQETEVQSKTRSAMAASMQAERARTAQRLAEVARQYAANLPDASDSH